MWARSRSSRFIASEIGNPHCDVRIAAKRNVPLNDLINTLPSGIGRIILSSECRQPRFARFGRISLNWGIGVCVGGACNPLRAAASSPVHRSVGLKGAPAPRLGISNYRRWKSMHSHQMRIVAILAVDNNQYFVNLIKHRHIDVRGIFHIKLLRRMAKIGLLLTNFTALEKHKRCTHFMSIIIAMLVINAN